MYRSYSSDVGSLSAVIGLGIQLEIIYSAQIISASEIVLLSAFCFRSGLECDAKLSGLSNHQTCPS